MEVHHHPHSHPHQKKWTSYLLEFLMLFLAVTLGFFAENIREHKVEKRKGKQLIVSLNSDVVKDTAKLSGLINVYTPMHNAWADSFNLFTDSLPIAGNEKKISEALINATYWGLYQPPEIALSLIKNSASFNLIENTRIKTAIMELTSFITTYTKYSEFIGAVEHSLDTSSLSFLSKKDALNLLYRLQARNSSDTVNIIGFINSTDVPVDIKFKTYEKSVFENYRSKLDQVTYLLNDMNFQYMSILTFVKKLLKVIHEEYPDL
jgi:hypothetical protein